jgi:hypothetical protein
VLPACGGRWHYDTPSRQADLRILAALQRDGALSVMVFAHVTLANQGREALVRFEQVVGRHPLTGAYRYNLTFRRVR